ncbi:MAG: phage tail tube protein [Deltaproteobacteria bacterium]|jgi:hypothetical protein|nr:phage tail tube protein [Deltaproteobacteria bacterium]
MDRNRRAGLIYIKINGIQHEAKGTFTVGTGAPKRDAIIGADGIHGYKETPQVAYIEGAITDSFDLDSESLRHVTNATVTLELNNGKTWMLSDAWYASEGAMTTDESEIAVRFESKQPAHEIK